MSALFKNDERFLVATKCCIFVEGKILILGEKVQDAIHWELPGGKISKKDTENEIISTLEREVFEELWVTLPHWYKVQMFHVQKSYEKAYFCDEILPFVYICYFIPLEQFPEIKLSDEHAIYKWITLSEIDTLTPWRNHFDTIVRKAFEINPV